MNKESLIPRGRVYHSSSVLGEEAHPFSLLCSGAVTHKSLSCLVHHEVLLIYMFWGPNVICMYVYVVITYSRE